MKMYKYKVTFENESERRTVFVKTRTSFFYRQDILHSAYCKMVSKYGMAYVNNLCSCVFVKLVKEYAI